MTQRLLGGAEEYDVVETSHTLLVAGLLVLAVGLYLLYTSSSRRSVWRFLVGLALATGGMWLVMVTTGDMIRVASPQNEPCRGSAP